MQQVNCYLCNANDYRVIFPGTGTDSELTSTHLSARKGSVNKDYSYTWVKCRRCGLVYADPVPEEAVLAALYAASDQAAYGDEEENISRTYRKYLQRYHRHVVRRGTALDIGAGKGFFLKTLLKFGFQSVVGIEPSAQACNAASPDVRPYLLNKSFQERDFDPGTIDFISCFQTLEHIHNPHLLIESFSRMLAKDGIVFFFFYNFGSLGVKLLGARHPIVNAGHLTLFDEATLRRMFSKHFEVIAVFTISNRYSLRYWLSLLPLGTGVKSAVSALATRLGLDSMPLTLSMGNIGIVAKKK